MVLRIIAITMIVFVNLGVAGATVRPDWKQLNEHVYYDAESITMDEEKVISISAKYIYGGVENVKQLEYDASFIGNGKVNKIMVREKGDISFHQAYDAEGVLFLKSVQALRLEKEQDNDHFCPM